MLTLLELYVMRLAHALKGSRSDNMTLVIMDVRMRVANMERAQLAMALCASKKMMLAHSRIKELGFEHKSR